MRGSVLVQGASGGAPASTECGQPDTSHLPLLLLAQAWLDAVGVLWWAPV